MSAKHTLVPQIRSPVIQPQIIITKKDGPVSSGIKPIMPVQQNSFLNKLIDSNKLIGEGNKLIGEGLVNLSLDNVRINTLETKISDLESSNSHLESKIYDLENIINDQKSSIDQLIKMVTTLSHTINNLNNVTLVDNTHHIPVTPLVQTSKGETFPLNRKRATSPVINSIEPDQKSNIRLFNDKIGVDIYAAQYLEDYIGPSDEIKVTRQWKENLLKTMRQVRGRKQITLGDTEPENYTKQQQTASEELEFILANIDFVSSLTF